MAELAELGGGGGGGVLTMNTDMSVFIRTQPE